MMFIPLSRAFNPCPCLHQHNTQTCIPLRSVSDESESVVLEVFLPSTMNERLHEPEISLSANRCVHRLLLWFLQSLGSSLLEFACMERVSSIRIGLWLDGQLFCSFEGQLRGMRNVLSISVRQAQLRLLVELEQTSA